VIYAAVVGSRAWGLADESSDEDVRGCFVAPFEEHAGLFDYPDELQDPEGDAAYWEVEKLVHQALRGDANTLETLWSPLIKVITPLGQQLVDQRRIFVSMNVLGSFGRYAQSQFRRIERAQKRDVAFAELFAEAGAGRLQTADEAAQFLRARRVAPNLGEAKKEVHALARSVFDRGLIEAAHFEALMQAVAAGRSAELAPPPHRPKNAYNLLRLLHSCRSWLTTGEPLIEVPAPLRDTLLAIKKRQVAIDQVLEMAKVVAHEVDDAAKSATLPVQPDYEAADSFLRSCRRDAARRSLLTTGIVRDADGQFVPGPVSVDDPYLPTILPVALPSDIEAEPLRLFLARYCDVASPSHLEFVWLSLSGAHAYGFPSPDSDLDLKAIHTLPAADLLGLAPSPAAVELVTDWRGREYDFSSNELGPAAQLLLKGNGNMLERLLGPFPVVTTPIGYRLRVLAEQSVSRLVFGHYRGFLGGMLRESELEARGGGRTVKRLLYAYRVGLTGAHALLTGEIVTDLSVLAPRYGFPRALELRQVKTRGELVTLAVGDEGPYLADIEKVGVMLEDAHQRSRLPEYAPNQDALEAFVIEQRLSRQRRRRIGSNGPPGDQ